MPTPDCIRCLIAAAVFYITCGLFVRYWTRPCRCPLVEERPQPEREV